MSFRFERIRRQLDARCYPLPDRRCFNSLFWQLADCREARLKPPLLRKPRQSVGKWLWRNGHQRVAARALDELCEQHQQAADRESHPPEQWAWRSTLRRWAFDAYANSTADGHRD
jgi:hypothetical protein